MWWSHVANLKRLSESIFGLLYPLYFLWDPFSALNAKQLNHSWSENCNLPSSAENWYDTQTSPSWLSWESCDTWQWGFWWWSWWWWWRWWWWVSCDAWVDSVTVRNASNRESVSVTMVTSDPKKTVLQQCCILSSCTVHRSILRTELFSQMYLTMARPGMNSTEMYFSTK